MRTRSIAVENISRTLYGFDAVANVLRRSPMTNSALVPADVDKGDEVHRWLDGLAISETAPRIVVDNIERAAPRYMVDC
jgi:hypothetical protein